MLKELTLKDVTAFSDARLAFSPGLNVIVGENATGKTHLLKLAYSVQSVMAEEGRRRDEAQEPTKSILQPRLAEKLVGVFKPDSLGRLARRQQGKSRGYVTARFADKHWDIDFDFHTQSKSEVNITRLPEAWLDKAPVYLPTRELLTIYPGFVPVYENHYLEFEETWRDTCVLLGAPTLRGAREERARELLRPLEDLMGGRVVLENGRFYLRQTGRGKMEMGLLAEGWRKIATLVQLIVTGSLLEHGYLYWDEPETNLNPRIIRAVSEAILNVVEQGIQVTLATHSLFLLRELDIATEKRGDAATPQRYFGLSNGEDGVEITQADSLEGIEPLALLDAELEQADEYLALDAHPRVVDRNTNHPGHAWTVSSP